MQKTHKEKKRHIRVDIYKVRHSGGGIAGAGAVHYTELIIDSTLECLYSRKMLRQGKHLF